MIQIKAKYLCEELLVVKACRREKTLTFCLAWEDLVRVFLLVLCK